MNEICYWVKTVEFINNLDVNEHFKPLDLKKYVYGDGVIKSTVGTYIFFLTETRFIERLSKGVYIRLKIIPTTLTSTKIYNYLYKNPLKERQEKLRQLKNNMNYTLVKD